MPRPATAPTKQAPSTPQALRGAVKRRSNVVDEEAIRKKEEFRQKRANQKLEKERAENEHRERLQRIKAIQGQTTPQKRKSAGRPITDAARNNADAHKKALEERERGWCNIVEHEQELEVEPCEEDACLSPLADRKVADSAPSPEPEEEPSLLDMDADQGTPHSSAPPFSRLSDEMGATSEAEAEVDAEEIKAEPVSEAEEFVVRRVAHGGSGSNVAVASDRRVEVASSVTPLKRARVSTGIDSPRRALKKHKLKEGDANEFGVVWMVPGQASEPKPDAGMFAFAQPRSVPPPVPPLPTSFAPPPVPPLPASFSLGPPVPPLPTSFVLPPPRTFFPDVTSSPAPAHRDPAPPVPATAAAPAPVSVAPVTTPTSEIDQPSTTGATRKSARIGVARTVNTRRGGASDEVPTLDSAPVDWAEATITATFQEMGPADERRMTRSERARLEALASFGGKSFGHALVKAPSSKRLGEPSTPK